MEPKVIIIGGGIAGLSCASHLRRLGHSCLVLEGAAMAGGNVNTRSLDGYRLEMGPNTFMGSAANVMELIAMNDLAGGLVATAPRARRRFIIRQGALHEAPMGASAFLRTNLLSLGSKLFLATEPLRLKRGEPTDSAHQFFCRRFGREAAEILAGAFISGVYAGDMHKLSAPAAFPLFWRFEAQSGSMIRGALKHKWEQRKRGVSPHRGLCSLKGGLGSLSGAIAERLESRLRCNTPATAIARRDAKWCVATPDGEFTAEHLVVAVPPPAAAPLIAPCDAELAAQLAGIEMAPMTVLYLAYKEGRGALPEGFGFLAPRGQGTRILGVLFSSSLFDDRAPRGYRLVTAFVGGAMDPAAFALEDQDLFHVVRDDLRKLAILPPDLALLTVTRHRHAIPQFNLGHLERMDAIHTRLARQPHLHLAGNYLMGVGMKDAVTSGKKVAEQIAPQL